MNKYTPGPWEFDGEYVWAQSIRGYVASPATDDMTSGQCVPKNSAADAIEANGFLIAAAPELLESLEYLVDRFDSHGNNPYLDEARAAIAKAKGETK